MFFVEYFCISIDTAVFLGYKLGNEKSVFSGGFANVYIQKSTGHILKKLKDGFLTDNGNVITSKDKYYYDINTGDLSDVIKMLEELEEKGEKIN